MNLDSTQRAFCDSNSENIRLLAPAGSGKTLSLLWRCKTLYEKDPDVNARFLLVTFTTNARDELKHRLQNDDEFKPIRKAVRIDTLNAWSLQYLRNLTTGLEVKSKKKEFYSLVNTHLRPIWMDDAQYSKSFPKMQSKYSDIIELFDDLKNAGFRHDSSDVVNAFEENCEWLEANGCEGYLNSAILRPIENLGLLDPSPRAGASPYKRLLNLWKKSCKLLWSSAVITLDDQKYWALIKLEERYKNSFFPEPNRYHHILIDEFQDISPLDMRLIRTLRRVNRASLVLVGDDDQAIFEWRGSTPEIILNPQRHFGCEFEDHILEINYRSPSNIVEKSQRLIRNNKNRVIKRVSTASRDSAEIAVRTFNTHLDSLDSILAFAQDAHGKSKAKEIAVIGRNKSQLIPLQILLTSKKIPYFAKQDLNVLLSYAFGDLRDVLENIATQDQRRQSADVVAAFVKIASKVCPFEPAWAKRKELYGYLMRARPRTLAGALETFGDYPGNFYGKSDAKTRLAAFEAISTVLSRETVPDALEAISEHLSGFKWHFAKKEEDIFYKDPPFLYLAEYARSYEDDFFGFIDHLDDAIGIMRSAELVSDDIDSEYWSPIHLMTAQSSKGKEFNTVILLDVVDGVFPSKYADTQALLEQERRVFYVSVTRARKRLLLYKVRSILGRPVGKSIFLDEMGL